MENKGFFSKLVVGLTKTRNTVASRIEDLLNIKGEIDEEFYEELEEILITSDLGVKTTIFIIEKLKDKVRTNKIKNREEVKNLLKEILKDILNSNNNENKKIELPSIITVVGVNGVGKTTTIGKLACKYKNEGKKVLLAAGDTFRAAAIDQLNVWANRAMTDIIKQQEGSDPAAVIYDAIKSMRAKNMDILICDTAGRLHNKKNLMDELNKINKIIEREFQSKNRQTFLVLDATTGQNAVNQAKEFKQVCSIDGIVLTKLDGTAKGGIIITIKNELDLPVKYIGVGEGIDDLQEFDPNAFVDALFDDVK